MLQMRCISSAQDERRGHGACMVAEKTIGSVSLPTSTVGLVVAAF